MLPSWKIVVILLLFLVSCKSKVPTIKPEISGITESIYASGILKSDHQYQAYATVSGLIREIYVHEGDTLKKGQAILSIANESQELSRENAALAANFSDVSSNQGKLHDAQLSIDLASNKLKNDSLLLARQQNLWQQNVGSRVDLEQRQLTYQNSRNAWHAAVVNYQDLKRQIQFNAAQSQNNLRISNKLTGDYTLRSELNGIVYELPRKPGELIGPQTPLALIGDGSHYLLEMQVDEFDILRITPGMSVEITMDSYKGKVFTARVSRIYPLMNERSKSFMVDAVFVDGPDRLYPNVTFEANIITRSKSNAMLIPRNYMLNDSTVIRKNGEKVHVTTGLKDYMKVEILSGLQTSDELKQPS